MDLNKLKMIKQHLHTDNDTPMVNRLTEKRDKESLTQFLYRPSSCQNKILKKSKLQRFLPSSSLLAHYLILLAYILFGNILAPALLLVTVSLCSF